MTLQALTPHGVIEGFCIIDMVTNGDMAAPNVTYGQRAPDDASYDAPQSYPERTNLFAIHRCRLDAREGAMRAPDRSNIGSTIEVRLLALQSNSMFLPVFLL